MNEIIKRINYAQHIVVIAHENPDADSLSSASAMYSYVLKLHKKVSFFCVTQKIAPRFSFLPWVDKLRSSFPNSADLAIALDCGSLSRLGVELDCDLINIDHHHSNSLYGTFNLVDNLSISTTQVIYNFFKANEIQINKKMATALYAGLLDDSNGLMSDDVDGTTFAMSKELIDLGADYKSCNKFIMQYKTLAGLRLKALMLQNMQLKCAGRVACFLVSQEDLKTTGAISQECEDALEEALFLPTAQISVLLKENKDLSLKGSIRCEGSFNALSVATSFDGGGHKSRAGFRVSPEFSLEEALDRVLEIIKKEI